MTTPSTEPIRAMFRAAQDIVALALAEDRAWSELVRADARHAQRPTAATARRLETARARHAAADAAYDAAHAAHSVQL